MKSIYISDKRRITEIFLVLLTVAGKFIFMDWLNWRLPFVVTAILCWASYIIYRDRVQPGIMKYWGFRTDNFRQAMKIVLPFGLFTAVASICVGLYQNSINLTWHIIPILILYPIWGTIQQFLLISLTLGNMRDLKGRRPSSVVSIVSSAFLFAAVHYPFVWLIIGTFILALFYGWVYLKQRNFYVLGIFHGMLGAIFYYTVLGRDPFLEIFGKFVNVAH